MIAWPAPFDDPAVLDGVDIAPPRTLEPGERPHDGEDVLVFHEGELVLRDGDRVVRAVDAPAVIGLEAWLLEQPRSAWPEALSTCTFTSISRETLDVALRGRPGHMDALARALAGLAREHDQRAASRSRMFDELYEAGTRVQPGPYRFDSASCEVLAVSAAEDEVRALVPSELRFAPALRSRLIVMVARIEDAYVEGAPENRFGYDEVSVFAPVLGPHGAPGLYAIEVYPDAPMPMLLGREIYGFPKRLGRIHRGARATHLHVGHGHALSMNAGQPVKSDAKGMARHLFEGLGGNVSSLSPLFGVAFGAAHRAVSNTPLAWPAMRVFMNKHIPSEAPRARPDPAVHQLIEAPLRMFGLRHFATLPEVRCEFGDTFPLASVNRVEAAVQLTMGLSLGDARVVKNYQPTRSWPKLVGLA